MQGPPTIDFADFTIAYVNNCDNILPKKYCQLKVNFASKGKTAGLHTANLNLDSAFIALSANVIDPTTTTSVIFSTGTSLDFGTITDKQSVIKTVTITNSGTSTINEPIVLGSNFTNSYDTCSNKSLAPKKTCTVKIFLVGVGKSGNISDALEFGGQSLALTGNVVSSQGGSDLLSFVINSAPQTSYDLGVFTGNKSAQAIIYLTNSGTAASAVGTATLSGGSGFAIAYNQCNNVSVAKNASCQVRVIFSSSGLVEGGYSTQLSFGSAVLTLNSQVESLITYQPTYSTYGSCSALSACDGPGLKTRTISTCQKSVNGIPAVGGQISDCASDNTPSNLQASCDSPAGQATQSVSGGQETRTCAAGQYFAQGLFSSLICDSGYHNNNNVCESDGPVGLKSLTVTKSGVAGATVNFSTTPSSATALSSTQTQYEFPQNTTVLLSVPAAGSVVLDSYSGDCSGITCSLTMSENKSVVVKFKDTASKFTTIEINTNLIPQCLLANGSDIRSSGINAYQSKEGCETGKNVTWNEFDCSSFADELSCGNGSNYRCFWDNMGGGGGGDPFMCQMMFGNDEVMCNTEGAMYGCSFELSCTAGGGGGSCQGGHIASCFDNDNSYDLGFMVSSAADCTPEKTKGSYVYSASTIGGVPSGENSSNMIELNGKVFFSVQKDYMGDGHTKTTLSSIDLVTNALVNYPQTTTNSHNFLRNVTKFNNKIYYLDQDLDVNTYIVKSFDGTNVEVVADLSNNNFSGRFFALDDMLLVFHNNKISKIDLNNNFSLFYTPPNNFINFTDSIAAITRTKDYAYLCMGVSTSVGSELYRINSSGVTMVTDLNGGLSGCSAAQSMDVVDYNNNIITYLATPTNTTQPQLYVSNGTSGGTYSLMSSANNNSTPIVTEYMKPYYSSELNKIFTAQSYSSSFHWESFLSNPSVAASTVLVQDLNSSLSTNPYTMGQINGKVVFYGYNSGYSTGAIYATNGSSVEVLMSGIPYPSLGVIPGIDKFNLYGISVPGININGKLYFIIGDKKLYESDGTISGTKLVKDYSLSNESAWFSFSQGGKMYIYKSGDINLEKGYEVEIFNPAL